MVVINILVSVRGDLLPLCADPRRTPGDWIWSLSHSRVVARFDGNETTIGPFG